VLQRRDKKPEIFVENPCHLNLGLNTRNRPPFKATDHKLKQENEKLPKALGRPGKRLGDFIEDAARPAAARLF
jgi:hypothetical protein